jgi:hypothetical protein
MKNWAAFCILLVSTMSFAHSFTAAGHMQFARQGHTATLLADGRVLVAGGSNVNGTLATAEIFQSVSGTFSRTGNMTNARDGHTATLLGNGTVLLTGGTNATGTLITAEIFHPSNGTFTRTGNMLHARVGHTATLLGNGKVLVARGGSATAELFDPSTGKFTAVGNMSASRSNAVAARLGNGQVLIIGGTAALDGISIGSTVGDLFNPSTGKFKATANSGTNTRYLAGASLQNGKVLIVGGMGPGPFCGICARPLVSVNTGLLFNPSTASFSSTASLTIFKHTATLLADGDVLVAGGARNQFRFCRSGCPYITGTRALVYALLYNPATGTFSTTANMTTARAVHTATLLGNGMVLVIGGIDANGNALASAEIFQ